jgi:hypothetical protein
VEKPRKCVVEGCGRVAVARSLCGAHYKRQKRHGHLDPGRPADWGAKVKHPLYHSWAWQRRAGVSTEWQDFWAFVRDVGDRPTPRHQLRRVRDTEPCGPKNFEWRLPVPMLEAATRKEYLAAYQREWQARNPKPRRDAGFKRRYGLSYEQYDAMLAAQRGLCLICKKPETSLNQHTHEPRLLSVDHCHETGKVRGLLCKRCNTGIGAFEEDPDLMKAAIRYVRRHKTPSDEG